MQVVRTIIIYFKQSFLLVIPIVIELNFQGIFARCAMGKAIRDGRFNIPPEQMITGTTRSAPFIVVGDQAFPLLVNLMRPYPEKQIINNSQKEEFNYRLSRARRVSENAFGISTSLFSIFQKPIDLRCDETRNNLIISSCILHNMIRDENSDFFLKHRTIDSSQIDFNSSTDEHIENRIDSFNEITDNTSELNSAIKVRETFVQYFSTDGALSWR